VGNRLPFLTATFTVAAFFLLFYQKIIGQFLRENIETYDGLEPM